MRVITRDRGTDVSAGRGDPGRPVLLVTMGVPLDEEASVFAVDTAVESGQRLVMANVTALEPLRMSITLGYDALPSSRPTSRRRFAVRQSSRDPSASASSACAFGALTRCRRSWSSRRTCGPACSCSGPTAGCFAGAAIGGLSQRFGTG